MKHIVCTVTNDLTYDQRMDRICTALVKAGYFVTLIGFEKTRSVPLEQKPYAQKRLSLLFKKGKLFYLEYNFRLFWYLLFRRYDIYNGIDLDTLLPVFMVARLKRKPVVYDAHEYFTELPEIVDRPLVRRAWVTLERMLLRHVRYNYTVSEAIAEALAARHRQTYHVIRNVPVLRAHASVPSQGYILYQGALNKGRGLEQLFAAMRDVDAELWIAGEGDLSESLRALAASMPHADRIRFLGYVKPAELKHITDAALIGVNLVEQLGLSYYFSLSNKFFDYIHAGIPQVTMHFPEYKRLNELYHVAVLVNDLEPQTLSTALNSLLRDKELYAACVQHTQSAKQELNWQREEEKLIAIYRQIG